MSTDGVARLAHGDTQRSAVGRYSMRNDRFAKQGGLVHG
jgi:hypothetical protein